MDRSIRVCALRGVKENPHLMPQTIWDEIPKTDYPLLKVKNQNESPKNMPLIDISKGRDISRSVFLVIVFAPLWIITSIALGQNRVEFVPKVVVVQFDPGVSIAYKSSVTGLEEFDKRASQYQTHLIERTYPFLDHVEPTPKTYRNLMALRRTYYVRYESDATPEHVAKELYSAPGVVYAEPIMVHHIQVVNQVDPNDPGFSRQAELQQLRLPEAWDFVKGEDESPSVVIAIVDAGGEWDHVDLRANVWTNPNEIAGNGIDDDQNGFIDDIHGVNFQNGDDTDNDPSPRAGWDHGTLVAGVAGAVTDNGIGLAGAAWNADIMHINAACYDRPRICYGYEGVLYAAANGADIINASWAGVVSSESQLNFEDQSINLATDMGALIVSAAGNEARIIDEEFFVYPALHPRVLSVGATQKRSRRLSSISNYGKQVSVFAPGESILTTGLNNRYLLASGTSLASPLVAGVAALVKTRYPDMSPDKLHEYIQVTSESMYAENPSYLGELGNGFVNALAAVKRSPAFPGVQLKRWTFTDDGNGAISPGVRVTLTVVFENYFNDAQQLRVELTGKEFYPFIDWHTREVNVGFLGGSDSVAVEFTFSVSDSASVNQPVKLFAHVRDGGFEDSAGVIDLTISVSLEVLYKALSTFYTTTNGDRWTDNSGWDIGTIPTNIESLKQWRGLIFAGGALVGLRLPQHNLTGKIPPEIGNLAGLRLLELQSNNLSGSIPPELGDLSTLSSLSLSDNRLSGSIPSELGDLSTLSSLNLYDNNLSGSIPPELGNLSALEELDLGQNHLSGSIPPELGNLSTLGELYLDRNHLSGSIPSELGDLSTLSSLNLYDNNLSGSIPPELGNLSALEELDLAQNHLSGSIPSELGNLSALLAMFLYDNQFAGSIPPELGNLSTLYALFLDHNQLSGSIPLELGNLSKLEELVLHNNLLSGPLPRSFLQLQNLEWFWFHDNSGLCSPPDPEFQTWLAGIFLLSSDVPVCPPSVAVEQGGVVPTKFTIQGNYPNPFRTSTRLRFDLPWPARVGVEVLDVTGRRVFLKLPIDLSAGWGREIPLLNMGFASGVYLYRLIVDSPEGISLHTGRFMRVR